MKFKENWLFQGNIYNNYVCLSSIVTLTKQPTNVRWHLVDMEEENLSRQIVTNDQKMVPKGLFMPICFCLYLFCTIFHYASKQPSVIERLLMEITPICRHLSLLQRRRVEGCWQKWRFCFATEYSTGPREHRPSPLYLILSAQKGYFFPDGLLN